MFSFQNGFGFKVNGGSDYVDLGDWSNDTCFVDVKNCEQGEGAVFLNLCFFSLNVLNINTAIFSRLHIACVCENHVGPYWA